jgi:ABC-2 type transport system permease protein
MSTPGSLTWFAQHESRLVWRDTFSMLAAGGAGRQRRLFIGLSVLLVIMHAVAWFVVGPLARAALDHDLPTLMGITVGIALSGSAILSQAMESVTRTFYARSDLELILSSPAQVQRLFAVRVGAIVFSVGAMSIVFVGPFINVLVWQGGVRWLGAYGVMASVALAATALAIVLTVFLFDVIGPKRTRLIAQIAAAVIGGLFAVGLQLAAMFSTGTMSRFAFLQSEAALAYAPRADSVVWWPARAAMGDVWALLLVFAVSLVAFVFIASVQVPRFARFALAASSVSHGRTDRAPANRGLRVETPSGALRRKEMLLILRDPWLLSQTLMQLLYLLPPAAMLWQSYAHKGGAPVVLIPMLVMAAGQLAGALAWLTVSGEDAPDLVGTAPVSTSRLLRSKVEAVMVCIGVVFAPLVAGLMFFSMTVAFIAAGAIVASAVSAIAIQLWFRSQFKRSQFQRRHASSRVATLSEAFSSITWAAASAIAAAGSWTALVVVLIALGILFVVRRISPAGHRAFS